MYCLRAWWKNPTRAWQHGAAIWHISGTWERSRFSPGGFFLRPAARVVPSNPIPADLLMPIAWGVMFELFFVGSWVWIIAYIIFRRRNLSKGLLIISICKAISFWLTFISFIVNSKPLLMIGLGVTAMVFGPL
jgi:hypothetical protein